MDMAHLLTGDREMSLRCLVSEMTPWDRETRPETSSCILGTMHMHIRTLPCLFFIMFQVTKSQRIVNPTTLHALKALEFVNIYKIVWNCCNLLHM